MDISNLLRPPSTSDLIQPSKPSVSPQRPSEQLDSPKSSPIPCILDLESGSSARAKSRKENSKASRRFRDRNQQTQQLRDEIKSLQKQCGTLKDERDWLRHKLDECKSTTQFPQTERTKIRTELVRGQEVGEKTYFDVPIETATCPTGGRILFPHWEKRGKQVKGAFENP